MSKWAITTSKARGKAGIGLSEQAKQLALQLEIPILLRENKGISNIMGRYSLDVLFVEENETLTAHWKDGQTLTYHPGMSVPRIRHMKDGDSELLIDILGIHPGDSVLDCTMGLASDAVTISYALGDTGTVTALESSGVIYAITSYGLQHWNWKQESRQMRTAMERVKPIYANYKDYLNALENYPDKQYDVIYFDPMFERPVTTSSGIAPLRRDANYAPLTQEIIEQARNLCCSRVVVKHRDGTLQHLQFDAVLGGKYSNLSYGVLYAAQDTTPCDNEK